MGSNSSKQNNETLSPQKTILNSTGGKSDPRSPTPEIVRTPLQDKSETKRNITKNANLTKSFDTIKGEDKLIHENPILSAVIKNHLQSYDPRSPTQEFERTPIIIASKIDGINDKKILRIQNENCGSPLLKNNDSENYDSCIEAKESPEIIMPKNLCNGFHEMSLNNSYKDIEEPLGSSTASNEAIENDVSHETNELDKPKKLLETNFEYVETGTPQDSEDRSSVHELDNSEEDIKRIPVFKILNNDPRSPTVGIERTPIVVAKAQDESNEENVEEMSDDTLIKVLQSKNAAYRSTVTRDNPDGVLIYEDESARLNDTPKKSKSAESSEARTPLSCMKNKTEGGHARSKSANTLHDPTSQKSRRASCIPRLKSLSKTNKLINVNSISLKNISKTTAVSGDCENTPPHSHRDRWDKDNSIVL